MNNETQINISKKLEESGVDIVKTINTHTAGEPTRIIFDDFLELKGNSIIEKRSFFMKNYDFIRTAILSEPRGHKDMFGAIVTKSDSANFGLFFMDNEGYLSMCGHGTIGVTVALNKLDLLNTEKNLIKFETPSGIIFSEIDSSNKDSVAMINVPSYFVKESVEVELDEGKIKGDVCYGGNYTFIMDPTQISMELSLGNKKEFVELGASIKKKLDEMQFYDSVKGKSCEVTLVMFSKEIDRTHYKSVVVFGNGQFDRSPCGTGSSAKLAQLFHKGLIKKGDKLYMKSIIDTEFMLEIDEIKEKSIIPKITGKAFITSIQEHIIEEEDKLKHGFVV